MDGYGNDVTASLDPSQFTGPDLSQLNNIPLADVSTPSTPDQGSTAQAIAQIFSTGVTAYTDSQAIQRGYTISNPRYFNAGYPGGVGIPYNAAPQGAGVVASPPPSAAGTNGLFLLLIIGVVVFALAKA